MSGKRTKVHPAWYRMSKIQQKIATQYREYLDQLVASLISSSIVPASMLGDSPAPPNPPDHQHPPE